MSSASRSIAAGTEAVHRIINEAIERGRWPGEDAHVAFRCECARAGCTQLIRMTTAEYEDVRSNSRRFVVLPGHEDGRFEDVVERHVNYVVVEKRGEAGREVEASDPRRPEADPQQR